MSYYHIDEKGRGVRNRGVSDIKFSANDGARLLDTEDLLVVAFHIMRNWNGQGFDRESHIRQNHFYQWQIQFCEQFETATPIKWFGLGVEYKYDPEEDDLITIVLPTSTHVRAMPQEPRKRLKKLMVHTESYIGRGNKTGGYDAWVINKKNHPVEAQWVLDNLPEYAKIRKRLW